MGYYEGKGRGKWRDWWRKGRKGRGGEESIYRCGVLHLCAPFEILLNALLRPADRCRLCKVAQIIQLVGQFNQLGFPTGVSGVLDLYIAQR